jgi:bacterioferritin-associated ferredoxin
VGYYLCVCFGVSHRDVAAAVLGGAETVDEVRKACGAGARCSTCRRSIDLALSLVRDSNVEASATS